MGWSDKPSESIKDWLSEYEGSLMCDCDHGCRQWIRKNSTKNSLIMRILTNKNSTTNPDKVAQMENSKVDKIFLRIIRGEARRSMRKRKEDKA